jgi:hypothetical protein
MTTAKSKSMGVLEPDIPNHLLNYPSDIDATAL